MNRFQQHQHRIEKTLDNDRVEVDQHAKQLEFDNV